jgi:uncharacterized protein YndB with AHSA1/START domain
MDPVSVSVTIARPPAEVFEYLADIANHAEFTDHYLVDWRLTREDSYGEGAGVRFRVKAPLTRFPWADVAFVEVDPPRKIVEVGRAGKFNRVRTLGTYELEPVGGGSSTRVTFTFESQPGNLADRLGESLGARGWFRRKNAKAMRRLRSILEEDRGRGARVTVAAG